MLHQLIGSLLPGQESANYCQKPHKNILLKVSTVVASLVAGLMVTEILALSNLAAVAPESIANRTTNTVRSSNRASLKAEHLVSINTQTIPDGIYLYGQSPELNRVGQIYMVFESRGQKVIGALYMPESEFDCFYGAPDRGNELALTVVNSYDRMTHDFALAIAPEYPVASRSDRLTGQQFALEGFHAIAHLSEIERRILGTCKQNYQQQIW